MGLPVAELRSRIAEAALLTAEDVRAFETSLAAPPADAEALAKELVRAKRLTSYQAQALLQNKAKALVLGEYVVLDKLGQGGMGMVLKAEHRRMKRVVALKVLSPNLTRTAAAVARFHREVQAAARLNHPHVVTAFDAGESKGVHYLVMEFVDGKDLSSLVKSVGPMAVDDAVRCMRQAALGLQYAHENGVVHRDIKPANLLLDKSGHVKILDMGLARIEDADQKGEELTASGQIMGTAEYMSPEQALDTRHADARSDVYSLGCALFYLLTGRSVYGGDTAMKKLLAHRDQPIPSLVEAVREKANKSGASTSNAPLASSNAPDALLRAVDALFRKMVAKSPADRPQTMAEVVAGLDRCLTQPEIEAAAESESTDSHLHAFLRHMSEEQSLASLSPRTLPPSRGPSPGPGLEDLVQKLPAAQGVAAVRPDPASKPTAESQGNRSTHPDRAANAPPDKQPPLDNKKPPGAANDLPPKTAAARGASRKKSSTASHTPSWLHDRRVQVGLGGIGLFVVVLGAIAVSSFRDRAVPNGVPIDRGPQRSVAETDPSEGVAPTGTAPTSVPAAPGAIDLLSLVDPQKDGVSGTWTWSGSRELQSGASGWTRIGIPYRPPTEYDLHVSFTRREGTNNVSQILVGAGRQFALVVGGFGSPTIGLQLLGGKQCNVNESTRPFQAVNGRRHESLTQVRKDRITVSIDGVPLIDLQTDFANLELNPNSKLSDESILGLGSYESPTTFHRIEVVEISGPGTFLRPDDSAARMAAERRKSPPPSPALAPFDAAAAKAHQAAWAAHLGEPVETTNSVGMKFAVIPPGKFTMGEAPNAVPVELTRAFRMGMHEVTREQYKALAGVEPWKGNLGVKEGADYAATYVDWDGATKFCRTLTEQERTSGRISANEEYRLPTEAEWEWACRAGTTTAYSFGDDAARLGEFAWHDASADHVQKVGLKKPNAWGLHDVHGNVWEWCGDRHAPTLPGGTDPPGAPSGSDRVSRGGGWRGGVRSTSRMRLAPTNRSRDLGFRVVRTIAKQAGEANPIAGTGTVGVPIDLLPLIDIGKDALLGTWARNERRELTAVGITGEKKLRIPYLPPVEYDLRIAWTTHKGNLVRQVLVGGGRQFQFVIGWVGKNNGFEFIDGKGIADDRPNPTRFVRDDLSRPGERIEIVIEVRRDRVRALSGRELLAEWKTDYSDFSLEAHHRLPELTLGLRVAADATFHRIEVVEIGSPGTFLRPDDPAARAAAAARMVNVDATFFNGRDLSGWNHSPDGGWQVVDGEIRRSKIERGRITLFTDREHRDFELSFEVRCKHGPMGYPSFKFRTTAPVGNGAFTGTSIGLKSDVIHCESLNFRDGVKARPKWKTDEFNTVSVRVTGRHVTASANGETMVDGDFDLPDAGVIGWSVPHSVEDFVVRDIRFTDLGMRSDRQRAAAERLLPHVAFLEIVLPKGEKRKVLTGEPLPEGPFDVDNIDLGTLSPGGDFVPRILLPAVAEFPKLRRIAPLKTSPFSEADFETLAALPCAATFQSLEAWNLPLTSRTLDAAKRFPKLFGLIFDASSADDALLARLQELPTMRHVSLRMLGNAGPVTPAGTDVLGGLTLQKLSVGSATRLTAAHFRGIARNASLAELDANNTAVDAATVTVLAESRSLQTLSLTVPAAGTDADVLLPLSKLRTLKTLSVGAVSRNDERIRRLAAARPDATIRCADGTLGPQP